MSFVAFCLFLRNDEICREEKRKAKSYYHIQIVVRNQVFLAVSSSCSEFRTTDSLFSSPSSKMCLMCSLTLDLLFCDFLIPLNYMIGAYKPF